MDPLILGIDAGTSSLKVVALTTQGAPVGEAAVSYPLTRSGPLVAEQDPEDWWRALRGAIRQLRTHGVDTARIEAIGVTGQMHGLVLLDERGAALGPCQTWADSRCLNETRLFERYVGANRLLRVTGSRAYPSATAPKLLWTRRHEPRRFRAAQRFLLPKDELRRRLTGALATDPTDASGTLLFDVAERAWSTEVASRAGIPLALLPPVLPSTAVAGTVTEEARRWLGLRGGLPVIMGCGDTESAALSAGLVGGAADATLALVTLGTAGQLFVVTPRPLVGVGAGVQTLCHAVPDRWHLMYALLAGGSAADWIAGVTGHSVTATLDAASLISPGAEGLLFTPNLNGTRTPVVDPMATGAFLGLRASHTGAHLARAVVEGIALSLRMGLDAMRAAGVVVERVRLAGGASRHPLWPRVLADALELPVEYGAGEVGSASGAALLAMVGTGALSSCAAIPDVLAPPAMRVEPDAVTATAYARTLPHWRECDALSRRYARRITQI